MNSKRRKLYILLYTRWVGATSKKEEIRKPRFANDFEFLFTLKRVEDAIMDPFKFKENIPRLKDGKLGNE